MKSGLGTRDSGFARPIVLAAMLMASGCGSDTPTSPSTPVAPGSETFSSVVAPGGASTRTFTLEKAGTITVTMTTAGATLGLGLGLPRVSGGGCRLSVAVNAAPGSTPQLTMPADAGQYCVQVYDLGTLRDPVPFAVKIDHP